MEIKETKNCGLCKRNLKISYFKKYADNTYSNECKECLKELSMIKRQRYIEKRNNTVLVKCCVCKIEKLLKEFVRMDKKNYKKKVCYKCYPSFLEESDKNKQTHGINYRLKKSLGLQIRNSIEKTSSTLSYIGCNLLYLREWLEYNFEKDMTWNNYNTHWKIDHVVPQSQFNLEIEDDKKRFWNWSNLFPRKINSSLEILPNQFKKKLEKFKEEGSTTKWFSEELLSKLNLNES